MERKIFICVCSKAEHQLQMTGWPDEELNIPFNQVFVETLLSKQCFWKRLVYGIKYIFGYQSKTGAFNEIILTKSHVKDLQEVVDFLNK